ncbi:hypothetical protein D3C85_1320790 [compost metagenome]
MRGNTRQDVFTIGGGGRQNVAVSPGQLHDQRRDVFRQLVGVGSVIGHQHLAHADDFGGCLGCAADIGTRYQQMNVTADLLRRRNRVQGRRGDCAGFVLCNNQDSHQITFASFLSFSTSSATDLTLIPALRVGGVSTFRVVTVDAVFTPSDAGVTVSSGFFLAFMMFGNDA